MPLIAQYKDCFTVTFMSASWSVDVTVLQLTVGDLFFILIHSGTFLFVCVTVGDATSSAFSAHSGKALQLLPVS
jgi:hypothetical protein